MSQGTLCTRHAWLTSLQVPDFFFQQVAARLIHKPVRRRNHVNQVDAAVCIHPAHIYLLLCCPMHTFNPPHVLQVTVLVIGQCVIHGPPATPSSFLYMTSSGCGSSEQGESSHSDLDIGHPLLTKTSL